MSLNLIDIVVHKMSIFYRCDKEKNTNPSFLIIEQRIVYVHIDVCIVFFVHSLVKHVLIIFFHGHSFYYKYNYTVFIFK